MRSRRTELGEFVFRLKNRNDKNTLDPIAETAVQFIKGWAPPLDVIVPVPPSRKRLAYQPVVEIAKAIGPRLAKPVNVTALNKIKDTPELKDVFEYQQRIKLLQGAFNVDRDAVGAKRILLIDDLYRSGATAMVVAEGLLAGGAAAVYMLAMTKTTDAHMTKVFIAGSRRLSRLNADVKRRIDTMIEKDFTILVGDANGADKAVQRYLAEKGYRNVIVHCMANNCRNNVAGWPTREILPPKGARGFTYYAAKDQAMVDDAAYGLMLWDGESKGTLNSVINMIRQETPVVVYLAPKRTFQNLRSAKDVIDLLGNCDRSSVQRFERELGIEHVLPRRALLP